MASNFEIYNTIAEFHASMGVPINQDIELAIHRLEVLHPSVPSQSALYRANYYSIGLVRQGAGDYSMDNQRYPTRDYTIYFTNPGHISAVEITQPTTGYHLNFTESFLQQSLQADVLDAFPFLIAEMLPPQYLSKSGFELFDRFGQQMLEEYESASQYKSQILGNLLVVMLLKMKELFWADYHPLTEGSQGTALVKTFQQNLEEHYRSFSAGNIQQLYKVEDYAAAQYLQPSYLSAVIERKTGKTIQTWIMEKTIEEAQILLSRSSSPIQQIALQLGFKDAPHFSRLFKQHVGVSPSVFREGLAP
ncbi:helix-turn-helix transcriptional regulator [filamentous cyanobacterium LEGE 11480]|uniref:Helix-turn-helix transcriptional regulator n=1 Tax=Romeriopsis navalis LEGE 11480 TaxID=2777977 RepID=A0A928VMD5_9CYAN|nr:helix-turn-helix transcriptional regulator [Romeriopsis navalis]MBE9029170.1 helix-turn-helix transcriptional regulator [Romeriopsis navalis LEGE 11480]